jgi:hypothetical protein
VAYIPLSQRVADALRKHGAAENPDPPQFQWDTPERTRQMVIRQQAPKKSEGHKMSMAQAMRELRKLSRIPR